MKKVLLALILLIGVRVSAQTTYWTPGIPTGSTSFSPTFRYTGTDSLASFFINNTNRWSQIYTSAQQNQRFILSTDNKAQTIAETFNPSATGGGLNITMNGVVGANNITSYAVTFQNNVTGGGHTGITYGNAHFAGFNNINVSDGPFLFQGSVQLRNFQLNAYAATMQEAAYTFADSVGNIKMRLFGRTGDLTNDTTEHNIKVYLTGGIQFPSLPTTGYTSVGLLNIDATGKVFIGSASGVTSFNTRSGAVTLTGTDVTTALGYTPYTFTGTSSQYTKGDGTYGTLPTSTGTVTNLSGVAANGFTWSIANPTTTPAITLTLQNATTSQNGQLTSTDWNIFNGKQNLLNGTGYVKYSGTSGVYVAAIPNTDLVNSTISGISLGSNLNALTFGTHLAAGGTSYNGSGSITISTDATATPTASAITAFDGNSNLSANNINLSGQTITTAAGTTTLTVASPFETDFSGTTTQTVAMPVTSTLPLFKRFFFVNNSTGSVTVQSSGGNSIQVLLSGSYGYFTCISTSGTTAASWQFQYIGSTTGAYVDLSSAQTIGGNKTATGTWTFNNTGNVIINGLAALTNFNNNSSTRNNIVYKYQGDAEASITNAAYLFGGTTSVTANVTFGGQFASVNNGSNDNYAHVIVSSSTFQAQTVTPWAVNFMINKPGTATFIGTGAITSSAALYINGQGTQGTNNYNFVSYSPGSGTTNIWAKYGTTRVSGFRSDSLATFNAGATIALGNELKVTEGTNGFAGQTTLVAGTKAISITGVTTASRAFVQSVSQGGTVSSTFEYSAVCTSGTLTITALTTGNVANTLDTSVLNYWIIN